MLRFLVATLILAGAALLLWVLAGETGGSATVVVGVAEPETLSAPETLVPGERQPAVAPELPNTEPYGPTWVVALQNESDPKPLAVPPPDPVQDGTCTLWIHVVDEESREPLASRVLLWRLDAPENEFWTDGDQLQRELTVPETGARIGDIPEGQYRVSCVVRRFDQEDPPPFLVQGARTDVTLRIRPARSSHAYVEVFSEDGRRLERARMQRMGAEFSARDPRAVDWRRAREAKVHFEEPDAQVPEGRLSSPARWVELRATSRGFDLGQYPEDPLDRRQISRALLRFEGRTDVACAVLGASSSHSYVSVSIDPERLLRHLLLPGGGTCADAEVEVSIRAHTVPRTKESPPDLWRLAPIRVEVTDSRYAPLAFEVRLADGEPADRSLRARE